MIPQAYLQRYTQDERKLMALVLELAARHYLWDGKGHFKWEDDGVRQGLCAAVGKLVYTDEHKKHFGEGGYTQEQVSRGSARVVNYISWLLAGPGYADSWLYQTADRGRTPAVKYRDITSRNVQAFRKRWAVNICRQLREIDYAG